MFDWIPTFDEVIAFWDCRIMGHEWRYEQDMRICDHCGKREEWRHAK